MLLSTADDVYLNSEEERREYVLAQQGFIYQGSVKFIKSVPWNFGQVGQRLPLTVTTSQPVLGEPEISRCEGVTESPVHPVRMQGAHIAAGPERSKACLKSHNRVSTHGLRVKDEESLGGNETSWGSQRRR